MGTTLGMYISQLTHYYTPLPQLSQPFTSSHTLSHSFEILALTPLSSPLSVVPPLSLPLLLGEIRFFEKNPDPKAQTPYIVDEAFRVPASSCGSAVTANLPGNCGFYPNLRLRKPC